MPYAPAKGFPDWYSQETPAQGEDAARPIRWLVVSARGLHVTRSLEQTQPKTVETQKLVRESHPFAYRVRVRPSAIVVALAERQEQKARAQ